MPKQAFYTKKTKLYKQKPALAVIITREGKHMKKRILLSILILIAMSTQVSALASNDVFNDVKPSDWYYNDVLEAQKLGLVQGVGNSQYAPSKTISYAEYITILMRVLDVDVSKYTAGKHWASQNMLAAQDLGILTKEEVIDTKYDAGITRQDMVKYSCKALEVKPSETLEYIFGDVKGKSESEVKYINAAFKEYLTEGMGRSSEGLRLFGYDKKSNRAELATMALRIKAYKENPTEYKAERAAAREKADKEWESKQGIDLQWKKLGESGGITSESQLTPEIIKKIQDLGPMSQWMDGRLDGGWNTPESDAVFQKYKEAIIKDFEDGVVSSGHVDAKSIVISKDLYWVTGGISKIKMFRVIVNGKEAWEAEVGFNGREYKTRDVCIRYNNIFEK